MKKNGEKNSGRWKKKGLKKDREKTNPFEKNGEKKNGGWNKNGLEKTGEKNCGRERKNAFEKNGENRNGLGETKRLGRNGEKDREDRSTLCLGVTNCGTLSKALLP